MTHGIGGTASRFVLVKEAAAMTGQSDQALQRFMAAGRIPFEEDPEGRRRIHVRDLIAVFGSAMKTLTPGEVVGAQPEVAEAHEAREALKGQIALLQTQIAEMKEQQQKCWEEKNQYRMENRYLWDLVNGRKSPVSPLAPDALALLEAVIPEEAAPPVKKKKKKKKN